MKTRIPMKNVVKPWLLEFLFVRGHFGGPEGKPLYSYQVTLEEFNQLKELLTSHKELATHSIFMDSWAAGYCLYVAERFRRFYDAGTGGWSWNVFDDDLDCQFSQQQKTRIVEKGLEGYWKRTVRTSSKGRDFLGSLFAEGGLPWLLVQSENHGFGRAVRRGLKHAYSAQSNQNTVGDVLALHENDLPNAFQNLHTRQLLAGIVEQLVELAKIPELESHDDPASYLDQTDAKWRSEFPIPLDAANARTLVNDWLLLAGSQRKKQIQKIERSREFTCEQFLHGSGADWQLRADVLLPNEKVFTVDNNEITTTRLQICLYEGDALVARGGFVYGQMEESGIRIRFPQNRISLERKDPESQIVFKLVANGKPLITRPIYDSELDIKTAPLVFVEVDDELTLVANESCTLKQSRARIRLPAGAQSLGHDTELLFDEPCGATWLEVASDVQIEIDSERYRVSLGGTGESGNKPYLQGHYSGLDYSLPRTVYLGWPTFRVPENSSYSANQMSQVVNGQSLADLNPQAIAGTFHYRARDENGNVVLKRTFGVVPPDFSMSSFPGYKEHPARIILRTESVLEIDITDADIKSEQVAHPDGVQINLRHNGPDIPQSFNLQVRSAGNPHPIDFRIPFPNLSAQLVNETHSPMLSRDLIVNEMLGKRIILCSGQNGRQRFIVRLRLMGSVTPQPVQDFSIVIGHMPVELNLHNYQQDVEQMLAATTNQDAFVQIAVSSVSQLLDFNIRRYNGILEKSSRDRFSVERHSRSLDTGRVVAEAMLLSDPRQAPLTLPALKSEGVFTGHFEIPLEMEKSSPWIIYPSNRSSVQFRPHLFIGSEVASNPKIEINSLHHASQVFHPKFNPDAINQQISLMASDLHHSGWQYMADLKQKYAHLPLSSFEAWIALAKNQETLTVALYRLELDELFCCRIRDELSTLWECVSLDTWRLGHTRFEGWIGEQGLPDALVASLVNSRMSVLSDVVPGFKEFSSYIKTGDLAMLPPIPPLGFVLPRWYQELRRNHESDDSWPTDLGQELTRWIKAQSLPKEIQTLSSIGFSNAVTYLPIFMAHVTVGICEISELHSSKAYVKHAIRHLSEFERLGWYNCTHGVMVTYLLKQGAE